MKFRAKWVLIWGYVIEAVASLGLYSLLLVLAGWDNLSRFVADTCDEWNDLTGLAFSATLAVWLTFINLRGSIFGDYLESRGAVSVYAYSFFTAMAGTFAATASMIVAKGIGSDIAYNVALALLIYGLLNLYSMMKNATDLVALYSAFRRKMDAEQVPPQQLQPRNTND